MEMTRKEKATLAKLILEPMRPRKRPAPKGDTCTKCGSDQITVTSALAWGPWSGRIKCNKCGYEETAMSHLGKKIVSVEPLNPQRE
jgi:transcription elongation factor Elf1